MLEMLGPYLGDLSIGGLITLLVAQNLFGRNQRAQKEIHDWLSKEDEMGVKLIYRDRILIEVIEKLSTHIENTSAAMQRIAKDIERVSDDVHDLQKHSHM